MKKSAMIFVTFLTFSMLAMAQSKIYVHYKDATEKEILVSEIDSMLLVGEHIPVEPDDSEDTEDFPIEDNGYDYVDMGLSVMWASYNVGAESPEEFGDYVAWGELKQRSYYEDENYEYKENPPTLPLKDDLANVKWGGNWRMPTRYEAEELIDTTKCKWSWTTQNGVNGYRIVSKITNNFIFIPATGFLSNDYCEDDGIKGFYWTSTLYSEEIEEVYNLAFSQSGKGVYPLERLSGQCLRAVLAPRLTCKISYYANGGTGTMESTIEPFAEETRLSGNKFKKENYTFMGWSTVPDGSGDFYVNKATIYHNRDLKLYAQWEKISGYDNGYAYVDLGLPSGNMWAIYNVGATLPGEAGNYYAWGETSVKTEYSEMKYKYTPSYDILPLAKDAAYINWGESWRMPTQEEFRELLRNCYWVWTESYGVGGYRITSKKNGNSIFLPSAGYYKDATLKNKSSRGYYWGNELLVKNITSTKSKVSGVDFYKSYLDINSDTVYYGRTIRAIKPEKMTYTISFDANGGKGEMDDIQVKYSNVLNLSSNVFARENYDFFAWNTESDGSGTFYSDGCDIIVTSDLKLYAQWNIVSGEENGHKYVDLGLPSGTKWASLNIGSENLLDSGNYFAWAEIEPKEEYSINTYKWYENGKYTKYCTIYDYGKVDNKEIIEISDDAANVNWGGAWRMPTTKERAELYNEEYCTWTKIYQNGITGYKVTSNINGNSIFLPATSGNEGHYWIAELNMNKNVEGGACSMNFSKERVDSYYSSRYYGYAIRPILYEKSVSTVKFDANGGEGSMSEIKCEDAKIISIPKNEFSYQENSFIGWNTKSDGTGVFYSEGEKILPHEDVVLYAQWYIQDVSGTEENSSFVDLGLPSGTLWSTSNLGAKKVWEYGNNYAWGEVESKTSFDWTTYKWCNGTENSMTKYCTDSNFGTYDKNTILELVDDVANTQLKGNWCMPTIEEFNELVNPEYTMCISMTINNVSGYLITSKTNGNSIFLPITGITWGNTLVGQDICGYYWTSSLINELPHSAFMISASKDYISYGDGYRAYGVKVRPVVKQFSLSFDANGGSGSMSNRLYSNFSQTLPANSFTRDGYYFTGWNTKADGSGKAYSYKQSITLTEDLILYAQWRQSEYVDLGLPSGLLWATMNVGAKTPEDYGHYFAWGATEPQIEYDWSTYKWCKGSYDTQTKYCTDSDYGTVDNKTILELLDDAANANWGADWRMPTRSEIEELRTECTWTWTTQNGVNGYKVTSKTNDNSIFLPGAGYRSSYSHDAGSDGYYWSSSCDGSDAAYSLEFNSDGAELARFNSRYRGFSVRAVSGVVKKIVFDANGGEGSMNEIVIYEYPYKCTIPQNVFMYDGYYFTGWNTKSDGTGTIYIEGEEIFIADDLTLYAQWEDVTGGHSWVDLGLPSGTKWATMNVGADSPEDYGDYFARGEVISKDIYTEENFSGSYEPILSLSHDAANVNWGGTWRMPRGAELEELINTSYTTWNWTTLNGVEGYKVTSKTNGNSIFLPAAGYRYDSDLRLVGSYGCYWSSSNITENLGSPDEAWALSFSKDKISVYDWLYNSGLSVRAVLGHN